MPARRLIRFAPLLLLLAAVAAWLFWPDPGSPQVAAADGEQLRGGAHPEHGPSAPPSASADSAGARHSATDSPLESSGPESEAPRLTLTVVDPGGRAVGPGVPVRWSTAREAKAAQWLRSSYGGVWSIDEEPWEGPAWTDAEGRLVLELPTSGELKILATRDSLRGRLELDDPDQREATLRLSEVSRFAVRALDPDGRPVAGLPVLATFEHQPMSTTSFRTRSDEAGLARFEVDGALGAALRVNGRVEVAAGLLAAAPVGGSLAIARDGEPQATLELAVPHTGALELRLDLSPPFERAPDLELAPETPSPSDARSAPTPLRFNAEGRARLPFVEVGLPLVARTAGSKDAGLPVPGPAAPQEERVVELRLPDLAPVVHAWIVPDPGPEDELSGRLAWRLGDAWRTGRLTWQRDPAGGFVALLPRPFGAEEELRLLASSAAESRVSAAVFRATGDLDRRRHELGTLRLEPLPLVAAGTVESDAGEPLANWNVRVANESWAPPDNPEPFFTAAPRATADKDGRFALYGRGCADPVELVVTEWVEAVEVRHTATLGDDRVRIRIASPVELQGRVLVDDPRILEHLNLRWEDPQMEPFGGYRPIRTDAEGRFTLRVRRDDPRVLLVMGSEQERRPLLRLEDVSLDPPDERLARLDLRDELRLIRLEGRTADGEHVDVHVVFDVTEATDEPGTAWRSDPALAWPMRASPEPGVAWLLLPRRTTTPVEQVEVQAMGHRPLRLALDSDELTAVLQPVGDLLFQLSGPLPPGLDSGSVLLRFRSKEHPLEPGGEGLRFPCPELDPEAFAVLAPRAGELRPLELEQPAVTVLPAGAAPQVQELRLTGRFE